MMDNDIATEANELQVHPLKEEQDMLLRTIPAFSCLKSAIWSEAWRHGGYHTRSMMEVFL